MREHAPITAILALAALFLSPLTVQARPKHVGTKPHVQRPAKHELATNKIVAAHKRRVQDSAPAPRHSRSKTDPKVTPKSRAARPKVAVRPKHRRHRNRETVEDTVPATITRIHSKQNAPAHGKASSADFLQAAGSPASSPSTGPFASPPAPSAATPVGVLSVVRPSVERPSLPPVQDEAATPMLLPSLYNKRGRLIMPPPLKGSHEILLRQNQVADRDGLDRIRDDDEILALRNQHLLVAIPASDTLIVDDRLPANRRYCRPWTAQFLSTMARAYYVRFHTPLQVNSAVRTVEFQQRLLRTNGNAAPAEGDTASPHLTGQAVDLAKHGLSLSQIAWLRGYLLPLVQQGKVDVEEEFQQACFHVSVYKKYLPPAPAPPRDVATSHRGETSALATAIH